MINYCTSNPCENGATCQPVWNGYTCRCPNGISGTNCDTVDHCYSNPCENGGSCINMDNDHICICPPQTTGPNCEYHLDPCASAPCPSGQTCQANGNSYSCQGITLQLCYFDIYQPQNWYCFQPLVQLTAHILRMVTTRILSIHVLPTTLRARMDTGTLCRVQRTCTTMHQPINACSDIKSPPATEVFT